MRCFLGVSFCLLVPFHLFAQTPQPLGVGGTWNLVFNDEMSAASLDTTKWTADWIGCIQGNLSQPVNVNYENEGYDTAQVAESDGYLNLNLVTSAETVCNHTYPYRSGIVQSNGKFEYTHGVAEARIYFPAASAGVVANWPAWWMDGHNWPKTGEIDIAEGLQGQVCYHLHYRHGGSTPGACVTADYTGWHTYSANWQSFYIDFYYDGMKVGTITEGVTSALGPMYLIINNATGTYGGPVVSPATVQVDYVRVWQ